MRMKNLEIFSPKRPYPRIDNIVVIYVGVVLYFQILLQISPIVTALAATPLYNIQTYLGLLGGGLLLLDLFTTKRVWQGKYSYLLLAILAFAAVASVKMASYGLKENLFKLCWMAIQFCLMYSCVYRIPKAQLEGKITTLFYALLAVWTFACCRSFVQYVMQDGYLEVVNPLAQDTSSNRQGFYENRLYGIFYTLNHAAYVSLFFAILAGVCALREKRVWVKISLIAAQIMLIGYIILSGSRSALVALLACALVAGWFALHFRLKTNGRWKPAIFCVVILLVLALCCGSYVGVKTGLAHIPSLMGTEETTETDPQNILDRTDMEEISNGRFQTWSDYISLYEEVGLTGLSPGNYMPYILEKHPELFVVEAARRYNPDKYESGIIYHVHSGYLMVYVSAGILGAIALAGFMVLCIIRFVRRAGKTKKEDLWFVCATLLVVAGAVSAMFDEGLFFQNNPQTTIFWLALGFLLSDCLPDKETAAEYK